MKKNVAGQSVGCQMTSATDGSDFTGSVTVEITKDNGTQTTGSVGSGVCTHEGKGYHSYAPAQAETNADHIAFTFHGTGAITHTVQIFTSFPQTGDSFARLGAPAGASIAADIASLMTKLRKYVQLLARKDAAIATDNATELGEINANGGSGSGGYANTTDAQEALRDRGDSAWITATGFSTHTAADIWAVATRALTDKAGFSLSTAGIQAIFDFTTSLLTTVGSIGKLFVDNINATISSRAPSSTALSTAQWTNARAALLDNADVPVSSRSTLGGTAQTGDVYALLTTAQAEPTSVPAANATPIQKWAFMFMCVRNRQTQTASQLKVYADDASTVVGTAALSDDSTTFERGELA